MVKSRKGQIHRIRAAVLREGGVPLKIETLRMEGPRDDEILVRIAASGVCHTDIDFVDTWDSTDTPVVLGHEGAGRVELVGAEVKAAAVGDHVVLSYQSCGKCGPCGEGRPYECDVFWEANFGFQRLDGSNALEGTSVRGHFFGQSSFATHALVTERNLVRVPDDIPLEILAPLGCGLQTGAGTVMNSLNVPKGASLAVFGAGAVGMASIMAARIVEAHPIIAVDRVPWRLKLALELGASHIIDTRGEDAASRIAGITGRGVDYAVEATGDWNLSRIAVEKLNPHGAAAMLAGGSGPRSGRDDVRVLSVIQGDATPQAFIPKLIDLYREGRFPFDRLIKFYEFTDINKAIADSKRGDAIKPVLKMGLERPKSRASSAGSHTER